jgi:hypothetical protein
MYITETYYKNVYHHVKTLKSPNIILLGLGRLVLSERKLTELIKRLEIALSERISRNHKAKSRYLTETRVLLLKRGLKKLHEENEKYEQKYNNRLAEQKENSGGNKK